MNSKGALRGEKYHLLGIAGRGMTPLAIVAKQLGADITGCDRAGREENHEELRRAGIKFFTNHDAQHISHDTKLVTTSIAPSDLEEIQKAQKISQVWHRSDLLATALNAKESIGITGSHGKGTVTALTTAAMITGDLDPHALVGVPVSLFGGTTRLGKGPLVAEVDDSDLSIARIHTNIAVVTNLDEDHPHLKIPLTRSVAAIGEFISHANNAVILGPSPRNIQLRTYANADVWEYGKNYGGKLLETNRGHSRIKLWATGVRTAETTLNLLTPHPEVNAAVAWLTAIISGADPGKAAAGLSSLKTLSRRLEVIATYPNVVIDDFGGKHPANVRAGIELIRKHFPGSKITAVIEPYGPYLPKWGYRYARALSQADTVVVCPPVFLTDYPGETQLNLNWHNKCSATTLLEAQSSSHAIELAVSQSNPGDVIIFFAQVHTSAILAHKAARLASERK